MGAWGHQLFQSDHDFDIISELSDEAGLGEIEDAAAKAKGIDPDDYANKDRPRYSLYEPSDPKFVREHLDSGILARMLDKYEAKLLAGRGADHDFLRDPGYILLLLGACAMHLGCSIPAKSRKTMQKVYMCVDLPSEGVVQMQAALLGADAYENGEPYDFNSPDLFETANMKSEDEESNGMPWRGLNVWGPGTLFYRPPQGSKTGLMELKADYAKKTTGVDVCGGCGAKNGPGGSNLLACGGCKVRKYCGKECQKKQWKTHKEDCSKLREEADVEMTT